LRQSAVTAKFLKLLKSEIPANKKASDHSEAYRVLAQYYLFSIGT
jgi:hypothetical protein